MTREIDLSSIAPPDETEPKPDIHLDNDLHPDDLRLTPAPKRERHAIGNENMAPPALILEPKSSEATSRQHRRKTREKKPKKQRTTWQKIRLVLVIILLVLLSLMLIAATTGIILYHIGKGELLDNENVVLQAPQQLLDTNLVTIVDGGRTVTYKGDTYRFNEHRTNILCIGVDTEQIGAGTDIIGTGGQADAIFILSIDTKTGAIDTIPVPRDAMADIDVYNTSGEFVRSENTQLCLSYAYADGKEGSCENTVKATERLFYGIPINTYFAIDLSAISVLNDAVGGVTVTLPSDFKRTDGTIAKAGQTITLSGEESVRFVRERDVEQLDSNVDRMARQKIFLTSFFETTVKATSNDINVPLTLLDKVPDNSVTNLNASRITYLATTIVTNRQPLTFHPSADYTVEKGEDGYAEYHIDKVSLYEQILSVFYTKL